MLDAGAGGGEVVYVLRRFGFDAAGIEPDEHYAQHAREALGVPVTTGFVQDASFPAGRFDVMTMYHALEHVENPLAILAQLAWWIANGACCSSKCRTSRRLHVARPSISFRALL